jgi:hypothetical protein
MIFFNFHYGSDKSLSTSIVSKKCRINMILSMIKASHGTFAFDLQAFRTLLMF